MTSPAAITVTSTSMDREGYAFSVAGLVNGQDFTLACFYEPEYDVREAVSTGAWEEALETYEDAEMDVSDLYELAYEQWQKAL